MNDTIIFKVKIKPSAKENKIISFQGDAVKIALKVPPVRGKANKALLVLLADAFGVKQSQVLILRGDASRIKQVSITGSQKTLDEVMTEI